MVHSILEYNIVLTKVQLELHLIVGLWIRREVDQSITWLFHTRHAANASWITIHSPKYYTTLPFLVKQNKTLRNRMKIRDMKFLFELLIGKLQVSIIFHLKTFKTCSTHYLQQYWIKFEKLGDFFFQKSERCRFFL